MEKIALVTGGNSGIGYATARLLKDKGYKVFISGRNRERLEQAANELDVDYLLADMSKPEEIKELASKFSETGLDVLVENAGIAKAILLQDICWNDFEDIFTINVWGPLFLIKELVPALEKNNGGSINIVSSVVAKTSEKPGISLYAATKGAVNSFMRNLVTELTPKNIRINAVAPGPIDTPMFNKVNPNDEEVAELKKILGDEIPIGRLGKPEEIAQVIVAQLEASYVTGAIWKVDGGVSVI